MVDALEATAREETYESAGGAKIFLRSWRPAGPARAAVVIVHGFNAHGGLYAWTAGRLTDAGFAVYALDLRGRGRSDGERYWVERFDDYLADVDGTVRIARARDPGLPLFLLGHSAGGVIACMYALEHQDELAGLICESFAFQIPAPDVALAVLKGLSHILPHAHVLRLKLDDFSRDPAIMARLKADPAINDEVQPTQTVAEMVRADERLKEAFPDFRLPLFIIHGTEDKVTRCNGSRLFHAMAGSQDKTLKLYEGHVHDLLADLGREAVADDIVAWIDARVSA
jgi:alpha-beta hydrolase superfamily lysophospholipase